VDAQPFGSGRHALFLQKLSTESSVNIIASTGLHKNIYYPLDFFSYRADVKTLSELFISEIEEGMFLYHTSDPFKEKSKIRAGIIKVATDEQGLTPYYKKVFDAAASAHHKTGAPILTHTELSNYGLEQVKYLISKGVKSNSIIISHMDRCISVQKNIELLETGVYLEYDTIGRFKYHSDEQEIELIARARDSGFLNRILLGMDSTAERFISYGGKPGLEYILMVFSEKLRENGFTGEGILYQRR